MTTRVARKPHLRDELREMFTRAKIPSSPALAAKILALAEDPDSTVEQFADLIEMDPALSTRLLNMSNSAQCAQRTAVTTVKRAVTVLGVNRVRTVSLGFQLVGHLDRLRGCPFDMKVFWRDSVMRGCIARRIAADVVPVYADEAFLVGLLQDCGILLLVQLLGREYAELYQSHGVSPTAFFAAEQERFPYTHVEAIHLMAQEWRLPEAITRPLRHHERVSLDASSTDEDRFCAVSFVCGSIRLHGQDASDAGDASLQSYVHEVLGLDASSVSRCLEEAGAIYRETAGLLSEFVPENLDVTELLSQANAHLMRTVEQERADSDQQHRQLKTALAEYRERAARDPLTKLLNRGALVEAGARILDLAGKMGQPVAVCFLDIDNFKHLNDSFGHDVGDTVLKGIAEMLVAVVPDGGIVGRYGGEEIVLVVPALGESEASAFAVATLKAVRRRRFPGLDRIGQVTCSLGVAWVRASAEFTIDALISAADQLMHEAKRTGKDRASFRVLTTGTSQPPRGGVQKSTLIGERSSELGVVPADIAETAALLNRSRSAPFVSARKQERKDLVAPCVLYTFLCATLELSCHRAHVRNVSTGGVGVLTRQALRRGEPVEVVIDSETTIHIAGLVAFCRHVGTDIFDVGIQTFLHSPKPILSEDPVSAIRNLDWVAGALKAGRQDGRTDPSQDD